MKIGIYDPYLDTMSGGEKYMLTAARCLSEKHEVAIFWNPEEKEKIIEKAKKRFDFDLSEFRFVPNIFLPGVSFVKRFAESRHFDRVIILSDGSLPFLACPTILHFQSPVEWVKVNLKTKIKLKRLKKIICNSQFTKSYIDKKFGVSSTILYPPVSLVDKRQPKENVILHVGRYGINQSGSSYKKQEVLLEAFKKMVEAGVKGWELVFVMSVQKDDEEKLEKIKQTAQNFPVKFIINPLNSALWSEYARASIYWHASGFGEDLVKHPDRAEHFGISTVEAMGMGAVPIVINAGGQKEIVEDGESGFLWNTVDELIVKTKKVIDSPELFNKLGKNAKLRAEDFSLEVFEKKILEIIT